MKFTNKTLIVAALTVAMSAGAMAQSIDNPELANRVRHELVMLPFFNVFDTLSYRIDNGVVTLMGEVTQPVLKSDAERAVARVEGVKGVHNAIEVLPISPFDDRIRVATFRSIYGYGPLQRYGLGAFPAIRIIVKNGSVTLQGVVSTSMDKSLANVRANQVPGVFSVTNELQVSKS